MDEGVRGAGEGEGEGRSVLAREATPPTPPPFFDGGMMDGGREEGSISPAWHS